MSGKQSIARFWRNNTIEHPMNDPSRAPRGNPRVLIAATSSLACSFYKGVLRHLRDAGFDPVMLSSPGANLFHVSAMEGVASVAIPMERQIAPVRDLVSFWRLYRMVRRVRPTIV